MDNCINLLLFQDDEKSTILISCRQMIFRVPSNFSKRVFGTASYERLSKRLRLLCFLLKKQFLQKKFGSTPVEKPERSTAKQVLNTRHVRNDWRWIYLIFSKASLNGELYSVVSNTTMSCEIK